MIIYMGLLESVTSAAQGVKDFVTENKTAVLGTAAGVAGAAVLGTAIAGTASRRKKRSKRSYKQDRARRSKQPWEVAYQKRKRKKARKKKKNHSRRGRLHYTKNGQPYIILKSGKARFVKGRRKRR